MLPPDAGGVSGTLVPEGPAPRFVITPESHDQVWRDLWSYRELLLFLAWRDLLVRYKQTLLGVAWALARPLLGVVLFTLLFGRVAGLPSGDVPYSLLVYSGLLPWQFVTSSMSDASGSLVAHANLVSKVYFPRLLVPMAALSVSLVDGLVSLAVLAGLVAYHGCWVAERVWALPLAGGLALLLAFGAGVWLAALNVRYRDCRIIVPFVVQFSMYASPVGYASHVVPEAWRPFFDLNPLVGVIDLFRWALLPTDSPSLRAVGASVAFAFLLTASGIAYFRATERQFADVI